MQYLLPAIHWTAVAPPQSRNILEAPWHLGNRIASARYQSVSHRLFFFSCLAIPFKPRTLNCFFSHNPIPNQFPALCCDCDRMPACPLQLPFYMGGTVSITSAPAWHGVAWHNSPISVLRCVALRCSFLLCSFRSASCVRYAHCAFDPRPFLMRPARCPPELYAAGARGKLSQKPV